MTNVIVRKEQLLVARDMCLAPHMCQPCDNFIPERYYVCGQWYRDYRKCPLCGYPRIKCRNCKEIHHHGGWNACKFRHADCDHELCEIAFGPTMQKRINKAIEIIIAKK